MKTLKDISRIDDSSLELLEAAGFLTVESLAKSETHALEAELSRANSMLQIMSQCPTREQIEHWILAAREIMPVEKKPEPVERLPVNYEQTAQGAAMLKAAQLAIPLPARVLVASKLSVSDIPPATLLSEFSGQFEIKGSQRIPGSRAPNPSPAAASSVNVKMADTSVSRLEIDTSRLRTTTELEGLKVRSVPTPSSPENDRITLIRTPRSGTNKGIKPESRRFIRGVLHTHPLSVIVGAIITLATFLVTPVAIISAFLLLLSRESPIEFSWVPGWIIVFPLVLPILGGSYLIWGYGRTCRICGIRLFRHGQHLKNSKAHHIRFLGYIIPLCIHIILFRWFRCTHCGTPVRLKE